MTSERSKRRDFLSLIFISKSVHLTRNYSTLTDKPKPEADGVLNILLTSIQSVLIRFSGFLKILKSD